MRRPPVSIARTLRRPTARLRAGLWPVAVALFAALQLGATCHGSTSNPTATEDVDLPGVDTRDFTPRERHEFSRYVSELASPCASVAVPVGQCVAEGRPCGACVSAAKAVAKGVREGMTRAQIEELYKQRFDSSSKHVIPLEGSPSRGPENAPVTIVEFADFECPFCQRLAPELDSVWEAHKDKVRFVYKFLPLPMHPHGDIAARAAIAAQDQGKFWEMHHLLFAHGQELEASELEGYARELGLDLSRFRSDMDSPRTKERIAEDKKLSDELGVKGTPTIYIDGHEYDPKVDLGDWLDGEIAAASAKK